MARYGYGLLQPEHFVGFWVELEQGAWAKVHPKGAEVALHRTPVLAFFKGALAHGINQLVAAQVAANDVEAADPEWSLAERRFVGAVQLLTLDKDPEVARDAARVQALLCDGGGTAMVNFTANAKVDFGRTQGALAALPEVAALVRRLDLGGRLDDVQKRTEDLARAVGRNDPAAERLPRSRRIERASAECAALFNWVHEGLGTLVARTDDSVVRAELEAMLVPLERLIARKPAAATANTEDAPVVAAPPIARTG